MSKYPKDFEKWWSRADTHLGFPEVYGLHHPVKRIAFNAWKASRQSLKRELAKKNSEQPLVDDHWSAGCL